MEPIFHIAERAHWEAATQTGAYVQSTKGRTLTEEGFIHCSRRDQVDGVAQMLYAGTDIPLVLLTIDPSKIDATIKVENGYPHVYGALNVGAVTTVEPFDA